jgi:GT2 family glycosyltransferase
MSAASTGERVPSVSVLIPTRNNGAELAACLESLRQIEYAREQVEIVVFDNGSTDDTGRIVRERYGKMETEGWRRLVLERSPENLGAFGGRAAAAALLDSRTDGVLSLDDDVELRPDALARLVAAAGPRVGVVGARIVYWDAPGETASAAGDFDPRTGRFRERAPDTSVDCDFVSSCGCLVSRAAWDATGGFDGSFFTSHGDVDLCLRTKRLGYAVRYEPSAVIRHRVARGGTRTPVRVYYGYRNKLALLRRHVPRRWRPVVWTMYGAAWLPKIVAGSLAHHRGLDLAELRAIVLAVYDGVRDRRGRARWFPE